MVYLLRNAFQNSGVRIHKIMSVVYVINKFLSVTPSKVKEIKKQKMLNV